MSQRKSVTMHAEESDRAFVPDGGRSAHFAALVARDAARATPLQGKPPHLTPKQALPAWSISLSPELFAHLERRRGTVPRADYLLWLLRLGTSGQAAMPESSSPDGSPQPSGSPESGACPTWPTVDGKLCCPTCGSAFVPVPRSTSESKEARPFELEAILERMNDRTPSITPIHPMVVFKVPDVATLVSGLQVGGRVLLLVGVGPAPDWKLRPLGAFDVADALHALNALVAQREGAFACRTQICDATEYSSWMNRTSLRPGPTIRPGQVLMMTVERLW